MAKTVLVPIADDTEELEAVATIDILRRAGARVTVASVSGRLEVTCSRQVRLVADVLLEDVAAQSFDLIALPGGMPGAEQLRDNVHLRVLLAEHAAADRLLAAVCAAPVVVLAAQGLLGDRRVTAHPSVFAQLPAATRVEDRVVVDGNLVTSRGPGTTVEFALALVERLYGPDRRSQVARAMVA